MNKRKYGEQCIAIEIASWLNRVHIYAKSAVKKYGKFLPHFHFSERNDSFSFRSIFIS